MHSHKSWSNFKSRKTIGLFLESFQPNLGAHLIFFMLICVLHLFNLSGHWSVNALVWLWIPSFVVLNYLFQSLSSSDISFLSSISCLPSNSYVRFPNFNHRIGQSVKFAWLIAQVYSSLWIANKMKFEQAFRYLSTSIIYVEKRGLEEF